MKTLVFRLYGPLASWGVAAVGQDRHTATYPGRSAILGLLGAALGIVREQQQDLDVLANSVQLAIKQYGAGTLLVDYHTSQVPSADRKREYCTRGEEVAGPADKLNTVLSARDYRCDGLWVVGVRLTSSSTWTLEQFADALRHPKFTLSLGRKSCPLAAPLMPQIVETDGLKQALDTLFPALLDKEKIDKAYLSLSNTADYYWEGEAHDMSASQLLTVDAQPLNRTRWQFGSRQVQHFHAEGVI